jgi:hypothetical protein
VRTAEFIQLAVAIYAVVGLLFALAFVAFGVGRVDPAARGASIRFRLLILPGTAALWPLMATKWHRSRSRGEVAP